MTHPNDGIATFHQPLLNSGFPQLVVITHYAPSGPGCSTGVPQVSDRDGGIRIDSVDDAEETAETSRVPMYVEFRVYPAASPASLAKSSRILGAFPASVVGYIGAALTMALVAVAWRTVDLGMMADYLQSVSVSFVFACRPPLVTDRVSFPGTYKFSNGPSSVRHRHRICDLPLDYVHDTRQVSSHKIHKVLLRITNLPSSLDSPSPSSVYQSPSLHSRESVYNLRRNEDIAFPGGHVHVLRFKI